MRTLAAAALVCLALSVACAAADAVPESTAAIGESEMQSLDQVAEAYVKLVLAVGQHDADYVDAYYGPAEWKTAAEEVVELAELRAQAERLSAAVASIEVGDDSMIELRHNYLTSQLSALRSRVKMLEGESLSFDEESLALYDAQAPTHNAAHFDRLLEALEPLLPGDGALADRYVSFRDRFAIPTQKLDEVFRAAVDACRQRTMQHLDLPQSESFHIEYVTDKSWSGYNWYQGEFKSLIQVNTDFPIYIDRAVDLACHEGYPGHHVYNVLLEKHLVRERGWVEFSIYPLFSPQSLIAEGTANYGIEVAFPGEERVAFERDVLFPMAGLDPADAERFYRVAETVQKLSYAGNEAARRYLNGEIDAEQAVDWLVKYSLSAPERAAQRVRFIDQYRSYVINYNLGQDLVRRHVESVAGNDPQRVWEEFGALISSPRLPSGLSGDSTP